MEQTQAQREDLQLERRATFGLTTCVPFPYEGVPRPPSSSAPLLWRWGRPGTVPPESDGQCRSSWLCPTLLRIVGKGLLSCGVEWFSCEAKVRINPGMGGGRAQHSAMRSHTGPEPVSFPITQQSRTQGAFRGPPMMLYLRTSAGIAASQWAVVYSVQAAPGTAVRVKAR